MSGCGTLATEETIPYVVVVKSAQFDGYRRRVVVPLVRVKSLDASPLRSLDPEFSIRNVRVVLHPLLTRASG